MLRTRRKARRDWRRPEVGVCIPAWESLPFIDKTLDMALAQTHTQVRVLVSVDLCDDGTAEACLARAKADPRLEVFVQTERLGWARNVNFLFDQVQTPFCFIYFHDDEIAPDYVELLVQALRERPDAMSAHCDMGHFGASDRVMPGFEYSGTVEQRLATWFVNPHRGSPGRSLIRSELIARGLRLPTDSPNGYWANWPYALKMLASGPAVHVPQTLYYRWDKREGGLTDGWAKLADNDRISGYRGTTDSMMQIVEDSARSPEELVRLTFCLYLHQMAVMRGASVWGIQSAFEAGSIHPAFGLLQTVPDLTPLGPDIEAWALARHASLPAAYQLPTN